MGSVPRRPFPTPPQGPLPAWWSSFLFLPLVVEGKSYYTLSRMCWQYWAMKEHLCGMRGYAALLIRPNPRAKVKCSTLNHGFACPRFCGHDGVAYERNPISPQPEIVGSVTINKPIPTGYANLTPPGVAQQPAEYHGPRAAWAPMDYGTGDMAGQS